MKKVLVVSLIFALFGIVSSSNAQSSPPFKQGPEHRSQALSQLSQHNFWRLESDHGKLHVECAEETGKEIVPKRKDGHPP